MRNQDRSQRAEMSDADLAAQLAAGEQWPMEVLYDRYVRLVFSVVLKILHDKEHAEDVVQEVFARVWRSADRFQASSGGFSSWLLAIAHNRAIDELRRQGTQKRQVVLADEDDAIQSASDPDVGPAEQAWIMHERIRVRAALQQLPAEQREVIELAYFGGLTQRDIADQTNTPLGTVKTRVRLGLQKLRELLKADVSATPP
jgi:RNA polymerase sigma-70 factor (ECF subfamily)